jgi:hypothetical protein
MLDEGSPLHVANTPTEVPMRRLALVVAISCIPLSAGHAQDSAFIAYRALTPAQQATYRDMLVRHRSWSKAFAERMVAVDAKHLYPAEAFRAAFSQLHPDEELALECFVSIFIPPLTVLFVASPTGRTVTTSTVRCAEATGGIVCSAPLRHDEYFLDSPVHRFTLGDSASLQEAVSILTVFRDSGIPGLQLGKGHPDYHQVYHIARHGDVYALRVVTSPCDGCYATLAVKVGSDAAGQPMPYLVHALGVVCY